MGADDRTRDEREMEDEVQRLSETHCYSCASAIARGDWVKIDGDYCPDCYRIWAESFRPLTRCWWADPRYAEVSPALSDALDEIVFSGDEEPPFRDLDDVDPLELLGRGTVVLAEAAYSLLREAKEMNDNLSGCDWCCGGGDERMGEIIVAFARINEQAKEMGR